MLTFLQKEYMNMTSKIVLAIKHRGIEQIQKQIQQLQQQLQQLKQQQQALQVLLQQKQQQWVSLISQQGNYLVFYVTLILSRKVAHNSTCKYMCTDIMLLIC